MFMSGLMGKRTLQPFYLLAKLLVPTFAQESTEMMNNSEITIRIPTTKEGRARAMKSMIEKTMRVKKEIHQYFKEHGTTAGYDPDTTYASSL